MLKLPKFIELTVEKVSQEFTSLVFEEVKDGTVIYGDSE
jgi:hypothetical protein